MEYDVAKKEESTKTYIVSRLKKERDFYFKKEYMKEEMKPLLIAGPCALEKEEHARITVENAKQLGIETVRMNLWKPRTSPGWEGVGNAGLSWLHHATDAGLRVAMEVLDPKQAELIMRVVLKNPHATLLLWIGARNQNHLVQRDIGTAIAGESRVQLMIKNPPWNSAAHWMGICEHVQSGGARTEQLLLCHRGIAPNEQPSTLRNPPNWDLMRTMQKETHLPMLVDPSHIAGEQTLVARIAMEAAQLPIDGQLIEVHPDPAHALTDAKQQLDWDQMTELLPKLTTTRVRE